MLDLIRGFSQISDWKTDMSERYYSLLLQFFTEVQERWQFQQFDNSQNISLIIKKLPALDLDKFLSLREENDGEGGLDLLWEFVFDRLSGHQVG